MLIKKAEEEIIEKIKKTKAKDNEIIKIVKEMKKTKIKILRNKEDWS